MSNLLFDEPRLKDMEYFLQYIYNLGVQNPTLIINHNLVYRELFRYGLEMGDFKENREVKQVPELFPNWINRNKACENYVRGLRVEHHMNMIQFLQFFSVKDDKKLTNDNGFIKLYIPMHYQGLYDNVNRLFDFITKEGIEHGSKVADRMRSDNVVVRLRPNDYESAKKIIDFVSSNNMIRKSLNRTNPFVPTINGIGIMEEPGITYNGEMATLIASYVNYCIKNMKPPILKDFYSWFKKNSYSESIDKILKCALGITKEIEVKEKDIIDFSELCNSDKEKIFLDAVSATYKRYGIDQVIGAINSLLEEGSCDFFTNGDDNYRVRLKKMVSKQEIISCINRITGNKNKVVDEEVVEKFCYKLFNHDLIDRLARASAVTLDKNGDSQLRYALKSAISGNSYNGFSKNSNDPRDTCNYRDLITGLSSKNIYDIVNLSLGKGLVRDGYKGMNKSIDLYIDKLSKFIDKQKDVSARAM